MNAEERTRRKRVFILPLLALSNFVLCFANLFKEVFLAFLIRILTDNHLWPVLSLYRQLWGETGNHSFSNRDQRKLRDFQFYLPTEVLGHKYVGFVQFLPLVLMKMGQGMIILRHSLTSIRMMMMMRRRRRGEEEGEEEEEKDDEEKQVGRAEAWELMLRQHLTLHHFGGKLTYVYLIQIQSQRTNITCKHKIQI